MKHSRLIYAAIVAGTLLPGAALADGALAIGQPSDVAAGGVAVGLTVNIESPAQANQQALAECKGSDLAPSTTALCRLVQTFKNQCAAIAMDTRPDTSGFGWAVASTVVAARERASVMCASSAGKANRDFCQVVGVQCDFALASVPNGGGGSGPTPPGAGPDPDPKEPERGFAFSASGARSSSWAYVGSSGPGAGTSQTSGNFSISSPNSGANSTSNSGGAGLAVSAGPFGSGAGAGSSTGGSSCAGAHC